MDANGLKVITDELLNKLPQALLENKGFEHVVNSIARIVSYLESEQDKRILLTKQMLDHQQLMRDFEKLWWGDKSDIENKPGYAYEFAQAKKTRNRIEKLVVAVLIGVVTSVVLALIKIK